MNNLSINNDLSAETPVFETPVSEHQQTGVPPLKALGEFLIFARQSFIVQYDTYLYACLLYATDPKMSFFACTTDIKR